MNYAEAKALAQKYNQEHLFDYYSSLSSEEKQKLIESISKTDFSVLKTIDSQNESKNKLGKLTPTDVLTIDDIRNQRDEYEKIGIQALQRGEVAAVLLAGGDGTRLNSTLPKGMYNIGIKKNLTIFEQQWNNIFEVVKKTGVFFHIFIMTNEKNDTTTREFFRANNFFGYDKDKIHFYVQSLTPACSLDGKIFLEEKYKVALSPNGNGGWYSSLINAGYNEILKKEGIKWINVYSVDNVLQRICDPVFIGATLKNGFVCSSKVVEKVSPEERVGVLCKEDGISTVIEYFEMDKNTAALRDKNGKLIYRFGVILNYLFNVDTLNKIYKKKLPYHKAQKAIPHIENGVKVSPNTPCGYKFETLTTDMIKLMGNCLAVEVERDKEFAPIKNRTGIDSVDTARELLKKNGVEL